MEGERNTDHIHIHCSNPPRKILFVKNFSPQLISIIFTAETREVFPEEFKYPPKLSSTNETCGKFSPAKLPLHFPDNFFIMEGFPYRFHKLVHYTLDQEKRWNMHLRKNR